MSEEKKELNINQQLRRNYKKFFVEKTSLVSLLTLLTTACLILAFIAPFSLIITVPLVIIPTFFGFIIENSTINLGLGKPSRIFKGFALYFKDTFMGSFKVISGLLKALLTYIIATVVFSIIFHLTIGRADPSYVEIFNKIDLVANNADLQKIFVELQQNPTFMFTANLTEVVSFGLSSYMFLHHVFTHSFKINFSLSDKHLIPMYHVNVIHRFSFPKFRKEFYKEYYGSFWLIFSLFIIGYVGGSLLGLSVLARNGLQSGVIGLFFGMILSIFFLPYLFDTYQILFSIESAHYYETLLNIDGSSYLDYKKYLSDKEKDAIKKSIEFAKEFFKEVKKEDKKKE